MHGDSEWNKRGTDLPERGHFGKKGRHLATRGTGGNGWDGTFDILGLEKQFRQAESKRGRFGGGGKSKASFINLYQSTA